MRLCPVLLSLGCLLPAAPAAAQQTFPYKVQVAAADVYVRSGPGKNYYPTAKLKSGDVVEVYRHDPGGWYAIKPPEGSFEWISGRYLRLGEAGIAEATAEGVAARVGSEFSDIRDVIQVRLHEGELVEVLDAASFASEPESGTWYKIAPPSGTFRWVHGKYLDSELSPQGIRRTSAGDGFTEMAAEEGESEESFVEPARLEPADEGADGSSVRGAGHWTSATGRAAEERQVPAGGDAVRHTNKFAERATDPDGVATPRRIAPEEFREDLDKVSRDLSVMLVEEPSVWTFDELEVRTQSLMTQAETAVERGQARLLLRRIAQSRDIKDRYEAVNDMETDLARQQRQLAEFDRRRQGPESSVATDARFDGVGRLRRVVASTVGAPQYALVDEAGSVRCFVTAAPGVNMHYYLGRQIGVTGIRGYVPDQGAQHVTAKHITPLDDRAVLR